MRLVLSILSPIAICCRAVSNCKVVSQHNFVFVIVKRNVRNVISNVVLLHATTMAVEEHVIYLLLISHLQLLPLSFLPW